MHIVVDFKNRFFHISASPLNKIEDFVDQGFFLYFRQAGIEEYRNSISSFSIFNRFNNKKPFWIRLSWGSLLRLGFSSSLKSPEKNSFSSYAIVDLSNLESAASLEELQIEGPVLTTNGYCVRIDDEQGQRIFAISESFDLESRRLMLARNFQELHPKLMHLSVLLLLPLMIAASILAPIVKRPIGSAQTSPPRYKSEQTRNQGSSMQSIGEFVPVSQMQDKKDHRRHPEAAEIEVSKLRPEKSNAQDIKADQSKDIDPMRCSPIERKRHPPEQPTVKFKELRKEEWIVCR
jgi:hypothetical protein